MTTNGTYYFYVKDASGNINKKSIVVSNIDKVLPTVQVAPTQGKWGKHNYRNVEIPITLSAQDSGGSGLIYYNMLGQQAIRQNQHRDGPNLLTIQLLQ